MTRICDYLADYIYKLGVKDVFLVSGGGMMFLSDGIARHGKLKYFCNHHEQACAMAASAYARYTGNLGVAYFTTGCGGTNAITGLLDAWQDSVPSLFISGQSKLAETVRGSGLALRQFGVQEADIISIVKPLTKYAEVVSNPQKIKFHLDKAVHMAKSGRPGPVWLDIPLDVQASLVEVSKLAGFYPSVAALRSETRPSPIKVAALVKKLASAKRPVIIAGQGIRLSGAINAFINVVERFNIPVVASRLGIDLLPGAHPLFIGRIGNKGDRAGNFAVQNSDLVISLGSRLSVSSTGHEYKDFAREADIAVVDIDPVEHSKKTVAIDLFIKSDLKEFFSIFEKKLKSTDLPDFAGWTKKCRAWKNKWPVCLPRYAREKNGINMYFFVETLSKTLKPDSVVVSDAGSSFYVTSQAIKLSKRQRYVTNGGQAAMGFTLPAAIGISAARDGGEVIGITGDGSLQLNIQELQTLVYNRFPVKLFVWNDDGYLSIRATQSKFFDGRLIGTDSTSGLSFPDTRKIALAYGIKYFKAVKSAELEKAIRQVLSFKGPVICEIICPRDQEVVPAVNSKRLPSGRMVSRPLEDMYPFLSREELKKEMIVPLRED